MVMDNETVVEMRGLRKKEPEEAPASTLSKHDREIIGAAVRIEIPIADAGFHQLELIADLLIGAGNRMKIQARRRLDRNPPTEREIKFSMKMDLTGMRQDIRDATPGCWNRNGTVKG